MSKFWSKFDIFTIDLRVILSIIVATGVYALLLKFLQKKFTTFFFIFISTPEGHERGTFWRIIISFQSGSENID